MISGRIAILAAAVLFSTGGAAIKLCGLSAWQVAGFRSGIAGILLLALLPEARTGWSTWSWVIGVAQAAALVVFVTANKLTTAANAIFLQSTAPIFILVLNVWWLREPVRRRDVATMAVLAIGLGLFLVEHDVRFASAPDPKRGNLLAIASGLGWAITLTGLRWLARSESARGTTAVSAVVAGNVLAFLVCLPLAVPVGGASTTDWLVIAYLGVFQVGAAYVCLTTGIRRVLAFEASLLLLLEPVLNSLWAWLVHGETMGPYALAGGAVILAASLSKIAYEARLTTNRGVRR